MTKELIQAEENGGVHCVSNNGTSKAPDNYPTMFQKYTSCRWRLALLLTWATTLVQIMETNMSFGLVCMVDQKGRGVNLTGEVDSRSAVTLPPEDILSTTEDNLIATLNNQSSTNYDFNTTSTYQVGRAEFSFSSEIQGLLISAPFYSGILGMMFGSLAARRFGPKRVCLFGMFVGSAMTLLLPLSLRTAVYLGIICRVIMGFFVNLVVTASVEFWLKWGPVDESAQLVSYTYSGFNIAQIIMYPISGYLCLIPLDGGWPFIFYVFGAVGLLWCLCFLLTAHASPESHPGITAKEKAYVLLTRPTVGPERQHRKIPWKKIAQTKGVYAFAALMFLHTWTSGVLFSYLPLYMDTVLNFDVEENGVLSSVPYIFRVLATVFWTYVSSQMTKVMTVTRTRKIVQVSGFIVAGGITLCLGYLKEGQEYIAILVICLATVFQGVTPCAAVVTPVDMSPQYASVLMSLGMILGPMAVAICPIVVAVMIPERTREQWAKVFFTNTGIFLLGALVFLFFGTAERQPWTDDNSTERDVQEDTEKKGQSNEAYLPDTVITTKL